MWNTRRPFAIAALDRYHASSSDIAWLSHVFDGLGLPMPEANGYVEGRLNMRVHLDDYGLVARIYHKRDAVYSLHPDVLQPVFTAASPDTNMVLELLPGLVPSIARADMDAIQRRMEEDGFECFDFEKVYNAGYTAMPFEGHSRGIPLILDREAYRFEHNDERVRAALAFAFENSPQARFFAPLYSLAKRQLPDFSQDTPAADPERSAVFWRFCASETAKFASGAPAILSNRWEPKAYNPLYEHSDFFGERAGHAYRQQLRQHGGGAALALVAA